MLLEMSSFKSIVTVAQGLDVAKKIVAHAYEDIVKNATQAWKNAGSPEENTEAFKEFAAKYLEKNTKDEPGKACYIVVENYVANKKQRPYTFTNVVRKGKRLYKTAIALVDARVGNDLKLVFTGETDARKEAKELYKNGFTNDLYAEYRKLPIDGALAFKMAYSPSKGAKSGRYIFFGMTKD